MSRLDAHWNCHAGFTRFSGHGARNARKMQLYADIRRWNSDGEHLVAPTPACSCVRTMRTCVSTPAACKPRKLRRACIREIYANIYLYVYFKYIGPVHTCVCVHSISVHMYTHTIPYMHRIPYIEYTANPANTRICAWYTRYCRACTHSNYISARIHVHSRFALVDRDQLCYLNHFA